MAAQVAKSVETLQKSDLLRRELVANVGHDLRTPLAALKAHLEEGSRFHKAGRQDEAFESLNSARRQADYLQRLVDDLFELSQLENPAPTLRLEPVPVAELLSDASRRHRPTIEERGIRFTTQISDALPTIQADGTRLLRVLDNLLTNACDFTDSGGAIELEAEVSRSEITIRVIDTGQGMEEEELTRIFDRYYRGDSSRTRQSNGTGLGLAICRAVAQSHGGELRAESVVGKGTTFSLSLPVDPPGIRQARAEKPQKQKKA